MATGLRCPKGHTRTWRKGKVPTRHGEKPRYVCFTCGRTFYASAAKPAKPKKRGK